MERNNLTLTDSNKTDNMQKLVKLCCRFFQFEILRNYDSVLHFLTQNFLF
jgi:hypothetical protein